MPTRWAAAHYICQPVSIAPTVVRLRLLSTTGRLFRVAHQTNLYFIRHGEGMTNISKHILDQCAGSGLTPRGIQQVQQLQQRLRITGEIQADVIVTSTFHRALETAQLLASLWPIPLVLDDDLQELRYGVDDISHVD